MASLRFNTGIVGETELGEHARDGRHAIRLGLRRCFGLRRVACGHFGGRVIAQRIKERLLVKRQRGGSSAGKRCGFSRPPLLSAATGGRRLPGNDEPQAVRRAALRLRR